MFELLKRLFGSEAHKDAQEVPSEAEALFAESEAEAVKAFHDSALHTPAEEVAEEVLHDHKG